jgi:hypothetical protein
MYDLTGLSTIISVTSLSGHDNIGGVCRYSYITENSGNTHTYTITPSLEFSIKNVYTDKSSEFVTIYRLYFQNKQKRFSSFTSYGISLF